MERGTIDKVILEHLGRNPDAQITIIRLSKKQGLELLHWLYKNHRKVYYRLAASYTFKDGKYVKSRKMKDKLFAYEGDNGYLPGFSDEPDWYYIYC